MAVSARTGCYALQAHQEQEGSPDVITGTLRVFDLDVYALLDQGDTLSFVTLYFTVIYSMDKLLLIRDRLITAQSRQKSYADVRRRGTRVQILLLGVF